MTDTGIPPKLLKKYADESLGVYKKLKAQGSTIEKSSGNKNQRE